MAITKVGTYRNPPEDITDYEAIVAHLNAYTRQIGNQGMILTEWTNNTTQPKIAMGSYISHGGVLYVVEDEDYGLPALSSDGTYYLRVAASGDTLAITYTTNITDYSWNAVYGGSYHADESQILPYEVDKTGVIIDKYKMINPWQDGNSVVINYLGKLWVRELGTSGTIRAGSLAVTGAISGASVDTGQGATAVHLMNQNLRTTDNVNFANINPPVDNNDTSLPAIGVGGFTFGNSATNIKWTMPSGTRFIVIGTTLNADTFVEPVPGASDTISQYAKVIVFRIA